MCVSDCGGTRLVSNEQNTISIHWFNRVISLLVYMQQQNVEDFSFRHSEDYFLKIFMSVSAS